MSERVSERASERLIQRARWPSLSIFHGLVEAGLVEARAMALTPFPPDDHSSSSFSRIECHQAFSAWSSACLSLCLCVYVCVCACACVSMRV